jgi:hypothetical protein
MRGAAATSLPRVSSYLAVAMMVAEVVALGRVAVATVIVAMGE